MAASENASSLNLGLADWPLLGNRYFRLGSSALGDEWRLPGSETRTFLFTRIPRSEACPSGLFRQSPDNPTFMLNSSILHTL
jgi:hypothetical protein